MVLSKTEIGRIFRQPEIEDTIEDPNLSSCNQQRKNFFPQASFELCDAFSFVTNIILKSREKLMTADLIILFITWDIFRSFARQTTSRRVNRKFVFPLRASRRAKGVIFYLHWKIDQKRKSSSELLVRMTSRFALGCIKHRYLPLFLWFLIHKARDQSPKWPNHEWLFSSSALYS